MRVYVSKKDIDRALENDYSDESCPIALALKRKTHRTVNVSGDGTATIDWPNISTEYILSDKTVKFVNDIDSKRTVKPFHARLRLPNEDGE